MSRRTGEIQADMNTRVVIRWETSLNLQFFLQVSLKLGIQRRPELAGNFGAC